MDRRNFVKTMGLGAAVLAADSQMLFASKSSAPKKPNVILIMTDDQGYGDLSCHGNPVLKTPNLDQLHAQSTRLTDFHVSPTCSPTRAALMTGRYCNRTGVWHTIMGRSLLRKDEVTMADVFADSGYRTGFFGKWHLGDNYPFRPQDRGFQEVLMFHGGAITQGMDYFGNDYFDDTYYRNGKPEKFKGYCTDVWFTEAMKFIETNKDRPFFVYLPTNVPHGPNNVAEAYSKPYIDKTVSDNQARFYGMIANFDDNMARLMRRLKELDLEENTILIYLTDNGTAGGDRAGMRGQKGSEYEGGHRVPCFIRWPSGAIQGGRDIDRLAAHIDLLPTLIDLCGLQRPARVKFDGKSLKPLLAAGTMAAWPERTIVTDSQRVDHPIKWRKSAAMNDRWRLVNGEELYDIKADPGQEKDVAADHPKIVKRLRKAYEDWWDDVSERFDEYCEIIIGAPEENPTCLMSHDIHGEVVFSHRQVNRATQSDGFWAVEVARNGTYEFAVRRWPREMDLPITETVSPSASRAEPNEDESGRTIIQVTDARLKIADVDETKPIPPGATEVVFRVKLRAGKTRCQAWLVNGLGNGKVHGAYYVYAKRL